MNQTMIQQLTNKKKLKIAQVVCVLPPYGGGIGTVAHYYSDYLQKDGFDVTVFCPKSKQYKNDKKTYKVNSLYTFIRYGHAAFLPQLLWNLWKFDVIHLHYPFFGAAVFTVLVKKLKGKSVKLVTTYHMDVTAGGIVGFINKYYKNIFTNFILKNSDKIIVSSEDYIEDSDIQAYYFKNINKFVELPFGVKKEYKAMSKSKSMLERYGFKEDNFIVGFAGGLDSAHYFKGVNFLIKAFSLIDNKNIKCLILGSGNLKDQYKKQVKSLNLRGRIKFTGYVDAEEMVDHYNIFDIFILPSINKAEAFGIVLIEAMACGKPLIASNLKGVRTVVDIGINGLLVEPKNSKDIADKIECLFNDSQMRKTFSDNCLKTIESKFRWPIIIEKLIKIYEE